MFISRMAWSTYGYENLKSKGDQITLYRVIFSNTKYLTLLCFGNGY